MLSDFKIYSSDAFWRQILSELGATVSDKEDSTFLNFDALNIPLPARPITIKTEIQKAIDSNIQLLHKILGKKVQLPYVQAQIIILLYKSGGMSAADLRNALGYSPNATTHAVDTAIYQLRKTFGRTFINNVNGIYKIGQL